MTYVAFISTHAFTMRASYFHGVGELESLTARTLTLRNVYQAKFPRPVNPLVVLSRAGTEIEHYTSKRIPVSTMEKELIEITEEEYDYIKRIKTPNQKS